MQRKQWETTSKQPFVPKETRKPATRVAEGYDEYLHLLQQRNRHLKQLQQKDSHHLELERREQGFSVYLNGANSLSTQLLPSKSTAHREQRTAKTADPSQFRRTSKAGSSSQSKSPSKSPSKRKGWGNASVELKTQSGQRVHVPAPDLVMGQYDEDFELAEEDHREEEEEVEEEEDEPQVTAVESKNNSSLQELQDTCTSALEISTSLELTTSEGYDYIEESSIAEELSTAEDKEEDKQCVNTAGNDEVCLEMCSHSTTSTLLSVPRKSHDEESGGEEPEKEDSIIAAMESENKLSSAWRETTGIHNTTKLVQTKCVQENTYMKSLGMTEYAQDTTEPAEDATEPAQDTTEPAQDTTEPAQDTMEPTQDTTKPAQDTTEPAQDTTEPAQDTMEPAQDTTEFAVESYSSVSEQHAMNDSLDNIEDYLSAENKELMNETEKIKQNVRGGGGGREQLSTAPGGGHSVRPTAAMLEDSLTEHTLKVVTERVKRMDTQKQFKLLELLSALDKTKSGSSQTNLLAALQSSKKEKEMEREGNAVTTSSRVSGLPTDCIPSSADGGSKSQRSFESSLSLPAWLSNTGCKRSVDDSLLDVPVRRQQSGRRTGVRGELTSGGAQLQSSSDTSLHTFLDPEPRLKTAVLSKGRRAHKSEVASDSLPSDAVVKTEGSPTPSSPLLMTAAVARRDYAFAVSPSPPPPATTHSSTHSYLPLTMTDSLSLPDDTHQHSTPYPDEGEYADGEEEMEWSFPLPELPAGRVLTLNLLTTWGDNHYIGLTGVEVYDHHGEHVHVKEITADPADINVLPEYSNDPRVVTNLLDGVNMTRDDLHMWLAPYTQTANHTVKLVFTEKVAVAMIRIWNYNKSRIHSFRGAKDVQIHLDNQLIFSGEIAKACGQTSGEPEMFGETILFTADEDVLAAVAAHDDTFPSTGSPQRDLISPPDSERPSTANTSLPLNEGDDERPFTAATPSTSEVCLHSNHSWTQVKGQVVMMTLLSSWRNTRHAGLTGVELLDSSQQPIPLTSSQLRVHTGAEDREGQEDVGVLLDGVNLTTRLEHMWMSPLLHDGVVSLSIELTQPTELAGMRVWNYNRSLGDSYMGVRLLHVHVDGRQVSPAGGYLVRRGPGNDHYDYNQLLLFSSLPSVSANVTSSLLPCGFVYQLQLHSSWGDPYYIGLTGLELYDETGKKIPLGPVDIAAYPESVNVLEGMSADVRTPDKLLDGVCESDEWLHMWLSPILPGCVNTVYVVFDSPHTVSEIKIWNYAKNPSRGAREFSVLVDDLLVHTGTLPMVPRHSVAILPTITPPLRAHTISLSSSSSSSSTELLTSANERYHVEVCRDSMVVRDELTDDAHTAIQDLRPMTSLVSQIQRKRK